MHNDRVRPVEREQRSPNRRAFLRSTGLATGGLLAGAGGACALGEFHVDAQLRWAGKAVGGERPPNLGTVPVVYRAQTSEAQVALTFDDGPSAKYTAQVLDILEREQVPATFFLVGRHVAAHPELARRAAARHDIGNHTWSHPNLGLARARDAGGQLRRAADEIGATTGRAPTAFRPPYGCLSGATMMVAVGMGYPIMLWDFEFDQHGASAPSNVRRMVRSARPGSVILGHDGGTLNCDVVVAALPALIDGIRAKGLRFVTVSELLAAPRIVNANAGQ